MDAARREVEEETGLVIRDLRLLHLYHSRTEGKNDHVAVFVSTAFDGELRVGGREVAEVAFFPASDLPPGASPATRRRIAEYLGADLSDRW